MTDAPPPTESPMSDAEADALLAAWVRQLLDDPVLADEHFVGHVTSHAVPGYGASLFHPVSGCPGCALGLLSRQELASLVGELGLTPTEAVEPAVVPDDTIARQAAAAEDARTRDELPDEIAGRVAAVTFLYRDPDAVRAFAKRLRDEVVARVRVLTSEQHANRPEGKVSDALLAPELRLAGDLADALTAVSKAVAAGADEAKAVAGELVLELKPDAERGGSATVRVGASGSDLKITHTQPTAPSVRVEEIVDVLAAALIGEKTPELEAKTHPTPSGAGARDGVAAILELVTTSASAWRTSKLDELKRQLESRGEDALAIRLGHAYGRASSGKARTTVERVEPKGDEK